MKKILCVLLATLATASFAADKNCKDHTPDQVLQKLQSKHRSAISINYSKDQATLAQSFQSSLQKNGITVTMNQVSSGSDICNFSK